MALFIKINSCTVKLKERAARKFLRAALNFYLIKFLIYFLILFKFYLNFNLILFFI